MTLFNNNPTKIRFCSAKAATGKTFVMSEMAYERVRFDTPACIFQPTIPLVQQTYQDEFVRRGRANKIPIVQVHGGSTRTPIGTALSEASHHDRQLTLGTHSGFLHAHYFTKKGFLGLDEALDVLQYKVLKREQAQVLRPHLEALTDCGGTSAIYSQVIRAAGRGAALRKLGHDHDIQVASMARLLLHRHFRHYVNTQHFHEVKEGRRDELEVFSILMPSVVAGFQQVYVAAAYFEHSLQYQLWSRMGVQFVEDEGFTKRLRYTIHPNSHLLDIYYCSEAPWSKRRQEDVTNGVKNVERMAAAARELLRGQPYVWLANARLPDDIMREPSEDMLHEANAIPQRLPNKPHGRNDYTHYNAFVSLGSYNPWPSVWRFLVAQGLTPEDIRRALTWSIVYQSLMRISLRDPDNHERKTAVVPDRALADWLAEEFPGATVRKLECGIAEPQGTGRKRKYDSNAEKQAAHRAREQERERERILTEMATLNIGHYGHYDRGAPQASPPGGLTPRFDSWEDFLGFLVDPKDVFSALHNLPAQNGGVKRYETPKKDFLQQNVTFDPPSNPPSPHGSILRQSDLSATVYLTKKSPLPEFYLAGAHHHESRVAFLRHCSHRVVSAKKYWLISPAVFNPNKHKEGHRTRKHIEHLWDVYFDIEGSDIAPEEWARLFPTWKLVLYSSPNHTSSQPRYRVVFLTDRAMTSEGYDEVYAQVKEKLHSEGYYVGRTPRHELPSRTRCSGVDLAGACPTALFFLPCQSVQEPEASFFHYHDTGRVLLNPDLLIKNAVAVQYASQNAFISTPPEGERMRAEGPPEGTVKPLHPRAPQPRNESAIGKAIGEWRALKFVPEKGHWGLFHLGVELWKAGMTHDEIKPILYYEAKHHARTPQERLADVKDVMERLREKYPDNLAA